MTRWMLAALLVIAASSAAWADAAVDLQAGLEAAQRGHYDDGIRLMTMAIDSKQLSPADQEQAYKVRGLMYQRQNKQKEAMADYNAAIVLLPNDASAYDMRGTTYAAMGALDRAIADYDKALQLEPKNVAAYVNRGFAYIAEKQYKRAISDLDAALRLQPDDFPAYRNRATAYRSLGQYDKAAADYASALRINPKDPIVRYESGRTKFQLGDFAGAVDDLSQSLSALPNQPYTVIWLYLAGARSGTPNAGRLAADAAKVDGKAWPAPIISLFEGSSSVAAVESVAAIGGGRSKAVKACETALYVGEYRLLKADRPGAEQSFQRAVTACPSGLFEHDAAQEELRRLTG